MILLKRSLLSIIVVTSALFAQENADSTNNQNNVKSYVDISSQIALQVGDVQLASKRIIERVELLGGYFLQWDNSKIVLRIPVDSLMSFTTQLQSSGIGEIMDKNYRSMNHDRTIANLTSRLKSNRALLEKYMEMVASATNTDMYTIENEMINVLTEVEQIEGQLRKIMANCSEAYVEVSFQYFDRNLPPPDGSSPFDWVNALHLPDHRAKFQQP